jgi:hypothetical protein
LTDVPQEGDIDQGQNGHPKASIVSYGANYWHIDDVPYQAVGNVRETRIIPEELTKVRESRQNIERYVFRDWSFENPSKSNGRQCNDRACNFPGHANPRSSEIAKKEFQGSFKTIASRMNGLSRENMNGVP